MIQTTPKTGVAPPPVTFELIKFLQQNWKIVAFAGLIGASITGGFLATYQPQFEAITQVQMAQTSNVNNSNNKIGLNPFGTNVEDPNLLIARLRLPSTYTTLVIETCGVRDAPRPAESLVEDVVKAALTKNVPSVIEIRIRRGSPEVAAQCAHAVFEMIKQQQETTLQTFLRESQKKLSDFKEQLAANQQLIAKMDNTKIQSAVYLATHDEVKYLMERIQDLAGDIDYAFNHKARLVTPVYVSNKPVSPGKSSILLLGFLSGLMVGVLYTLGRRYIKTMHHCRTNSSRLTP